MTQAPTNRRRKQRKGVPNKLDPALAEALAGDGTARMGTVHEGVQRPAQSIRAWRCTRSGQVMGRMCAPPNSPDSEHQRARQNRAKFDRAFKKFTSECNSCHEGVSREFIKIRVPVTSPMMTSPLSNQLFAP